MSLNYRTVGVYDIPAITIFEAPRVMRRVFFGLYIVAWEDESFTAHISFDDPKCVNYLTLNTLREYEFECADIPQGIVFIKKQSNAVGSISAIEILK